MSTTDRPPNGNGWSTSDVIVDAVEGDQVRISKYLSAPLTVYRKYATVYGVVLVLKSSGGSSYRLRSTGPDDDLLLEKNQGIGDWDAFLRVQARIVDDE